MLKIENVIIGKWHTRFVWLDNGDTCRIYFFPFKDGVNVDVYHEFPHIDLNRKKMNYSLIYNNKYYNSVDRMIDDFCSDFQLKSDSIKLLAIHIMDNLLLYFNL